MNDYTVVAIFAAVGIGFVVVTLGMAWLLRPIHRPTGEKDATYECGEVPVGQAWAQIRVGYYMYLLIFVVFDVEVLFIFPWALVGGKLKNAGLAWLWWIDMFIFTGILAVALAYAWKKGVLKWEA